MPFDMTKTATETHVALTLKSRNAKVGPIPVSTSSAKTCPDACPLKAAGCYADGGPLNIFWQKVSAKKAGQAFDRFLTQIEALPEGQLWRHNQAGDLIPNPADSETIDHATLIDLARANAGKRGFTYTHFDPIENRANRESIAAANRAGFTVNLSGNNPAHADRLAETKAGPVVTVLPQEYERKSHKGEWTETLTEYRQRMAGLRHETPKGLGIVVCPATYTDTNCKACQLCQRQNRKMIVGFPAHGFRTRKADLVAQGAA